MICCGNVEKMVGLLLCLFEELWIFEHVAKECHCLLLFPLCVDLLRCELKVGWQLLSEMWLLVDVTLELVSFVLELVKLVTKL